MQLDDEQGASPTQTQNQVALWNPVAALDRCWRLALPLGIVLAVATAFAVISTFAPLYRASCLLSSTTYDTSNPTTENPANLEKSLVYAPTVLDPVLDEPGIREAPSLSDPTNAHSNLIKNLSVSSGKDNGSIIVAYVDTDGAAATRVCNAVGESYLRQRNALNLKRESSLEHWLEPEIKKWESKAWEKKCELEELRWEELRWLHKVPVVGAPAAQDESGRENYRMLLAKVSAITFDLEILDAQLNLSIAKNESESGFQLLQLGDDLEPFQTERETRRERNLMVAKLQVLRKNLEEEKSRLEQYGQHAAQLFFARLEYAIANEVLGKLRSRVAQLRTERPRVFGVTPLAPASPINKMPLDKAGRYAAAAFFSPFLVGYLLGFLPRPRHKPVESNE